MIDIKPPVNSMENQSSEPEIDPMLSPDLYVRWKGVKDKVRNLIYEYPNARYEDDVPINLRLLTDIMYLLEEGTIYAYQSQHIDKPLKDMNETLKEILKVIRGGRR